jgi:hypothetical protein
MANAIRLIFAGFSLLLIGTFLYCSPELVALHPTRKIRNGSPTLLATLCAFVVFETFLIGFLFSRLIKPTSGNENQTFGISAMLIFVLIVALPLAIAPIYQSVVSTVPSHPRGDRGLPNWLFITLAYTMLLPITYLCQTGKRLIKRKRQPSA